MMAYMTEQLFTKWKIICVSLRKSTAHLRKSLVKTWQDLISIGNFPKSWKYTGEWLLPVIQAYEFP